MIEHVELVQAPRRRLARVFTSELGHHGRVISVRNSPQCECSLVADCSEVKWSRFIRLSKSFPDLAGPPLQALNELCLDARQSEEFFLTVDGNQWVRTVIKHEDLDPITMWAERPETLSELVSSVIIHSNILPYDPLWSKLLGEDAVSVHFSSCMLKEALKDQSKTLKTKLQEWNCPAIEVKRGSGGFEDERKLFWEIQADDVMLVKRLAQGSDGKISLITWRGGRFVRKEYINPKRFDAELDVVRRLSHPHIVYSFGELQSGELQRSYFMEYMTKDLFLFIADRLGCGASPPFSPHESVDVLLQIAKAMRHMHDKSVNVIHCDLKSDNILLSEIKSENGVHCLVKVADFGNAKIVDSRFAFNPGHGTTNYAAPEVLRQRTDKTVCIDSPHKIDVYGFGIVAFEVLTGKNTRKLSQRSPSTFKYAVIYENARPPLREECGQHKEYTQDKDLISLIEKCWDADPVKRPSFVEICEDLDRARLRILEQMPQSNQLNCKEESAWYFKLFQVVAGAAAYLTQRAFG